MKTGPFASIVLAGERNPDDPLLRETGVLSKAALEIDGKPMIIRVLHALQASTKVDTRLLSGPDRDSVSMLPELREWIDSNRARWIEPGSSPSASAHAAMQTIETGYPVLLTTADHALLHADIVDYFCTHAEREGFDIAVGLAHYGLIHETYPKLKKTVMHFRDGDFCGCNLFAFMTPQARGIADYWRRVEEWRKSPFRIIGILGWFTVIRYLAGRLTLEDGLRRLSERLKLKIGVVILPWPEAAVDVDTIDDYRVVQEIIRTRSSRQVPG
jgi:GTP:adenosylcobinamide-phosphate guanylyltransferase